MNKTPTRRNLMHRFALALGGWLAYGVALMAGVGLAAEDRGDDYLTRIKPMLRQRCFTCHGALKQESGLRLDTVAAMIAGGDSGAAIARGDASNSLILERVSATDIDDRMPPEHEGDPLSAEQIALLRAWIEAGAPAPADEQPDADPKNHWAFRPIVRPAVPAVDNQAWVKNPIDAFLARQHQQHGLAPQPEAPRVVLLRRLYLDLIGVPPSADEIAAFERDPSPQLYEHTVDRLLDDPRHGERWARHWMDIWRYSDWWGLGAQLRNSQPHIWHWRDWIVESLNRDTPYDEMVRQMLAADELYPNDLDKLRATGFLARNYFLFNRNQWMEETVEHVSKGLLGLTMNCAKCHDHKYDPIAQVDFYRMRAFFEPYHVRVDVVPGETDLARDGIPRVFDGLPDAPTYRFIRGQEKQPDTSTIIAPGVPDLLAFDKLRIEPVTLPVEAWQPERRPWVVETQLAAAEKRLVTAESELLEAAKQAAGATDVATAQAAEKAAQANVEAVRAERTSIQRRAEAMQAEDDANRQAKTIAAVQAERQLAVAKARHAVAVAEQSLLRAAADKNDEAGKAVKTAQAALDKAIAAADAEVKPTDTFTPFVGAKWTPTRFRNSGSDDATVEFQPQSTGRRTALANWITDRRNPLTARVAANHIWTRHMGQPLVPTVFDFGRNGARPTHPELLDWLAAELIDSGWSMKHLHRVIVGSAAYRMSSSTAGGEAMAAKDPDNRYCWRRVPIRLESEVIRDSILALAGKLDRTMGGPPVPPAQQAASTRRSLYFFHSNNDRNLFLTTFDEALVKECYRREQSIVPQQALALINSQLVLDGAEQIAKRLSASVADDADFVRTAFAVLLAMTPSDAELAASHDALEAWRQLPNGSADSARANLVWALINHNDFVTLR